MDESEFIECLEKLCDSLESLYDNGVRDLAGLKSAVSRLRARLVKGGDETRPLRLDMSRISFEIPPGHKHTLPSETENPVVSLSICLHFSNNEAIFDEIEKLNVDFEVSAINSAGEQFRSAWHLDYHNVIGDEHFSHPKFHFQFGGKKLRVSALDASSPFNPGELLLMETPRIMHPPLDIVLAVDFIFGNFLGSKALRKLRSISGYSRIHEKSKRCFWSPYFEAISGHLNSSSDSYEAKYLNPGL